MRRFIICLLFVALLPSVVFAQSEDNRILYEFDEDTFLDTNLGFKFYYPAGWVFGSSNRISIAENEADLEVHLDDDPDTVPEGVLIGIVGFPLEQLAEALGENPTTEQAAKLVEKQSDIELIGRFEVPVMAHYAISLVGINNDNGRHGIATVWLSEAYLNILTISAPDQDTLGNLAYTWGVILGKVEPLDSAEIGNDVLTSAEQDFVVPIPEGWVLNPDLPGSVFELQKDVESGGENIQGLYILTDDKALEDRQLDDDANVEDLAAMNAIAFGIEPERLHEFVVLDQPAITFKGENPDGSGQWVVVTQFIYNGRAITLFAIAPDENTMNEFYPTWIALMDRIHVSESDE